MASEVGSQAGSLELSEGTDSTYDPHAAAIDEPLSIIQPLSYSTASCGYCAEEKGTRSKRKTARSYGCWAHALSCKAYKDLIDRGWRRSGSYLYKPDMRSTCCPQYTISLDTQHFKPTKSQRQMLTRFNNFIMHGGREGEKGWGPGPSSTAATAVSSTQGSTRTVKSDSALSKSVAVNFNPRQRPVLEDDDEDQVMKPVASSSKASAAGLHRLSSLPANKKGKSPAANAPRDLLELIHEAEWANSSPDAPFSHRFEYTVEPASFTEEKFGLFKLYQTQIHGEPESKVTRRGFTRFLVDSPLELESSPSDSVQYGSHHGLYRLDGQLIAFAVLDILPGAVSSVYFVWHPDYAGMSLGKVSALREVAMVREYNAEGASMSAYMMGYFILKCPKMRYKGEYQPSFLLDPDTNVFYPYDKCIALLEKDDRASFSGKRVHASPRRSDTTVVGGLPTPGESDYEQQQRKEGESAEVVVDEEEDDDGDVPWPDPPPPGCLHPEFLPRELLIDVSIIEKHTLVPLMFSQSWHDASRRKDIKTCLAALGDVMAGRLAIWIG